MSTDLLSCGGIVPPDSSSQDRDDTRSPSSMRGKMPRDCQQPGVNVGLRCSCRRRARAYLTHLNDTRARLRCHHAAGQASCRRSCAAAGCSRTGTGWSK
eukprot:scaffold1615_cov103-Isochrysis_galbana.AAC.8